MLEFKDFKSTRQEVYDAFRQSRDARLKERYYCVLLAYDGLNLSEIAATLCRDFSTVRQWIQLFNDGGLDGIRKPIARTSKSAKAAPLQRAALATLDCVDALPETT